MGKIICLRTKPFSAACVLSCITTIVTTYALLKHAGTLSTSINTEPRTKQKDSLFIDWTSWETIKHNLKYAVQTLVTMFQHVGCGGNRGSEVSCISFLIQFLPPNLTCDGEKKGFRVVNTITKVHLVKAMVFPVVMYGCESWTIKKAECWRIDAFHCGVGEDSRESLGPQGDPINPS